MKINWKAVGVFSGVATYYVVRTLILVFTDVHNLMLYIYALCAFLTLAFLAIWILTDWVMYLNKRYIELSSSIDELKLNFECVDENIDRLYINDVVASYRKENDR